MYESTHLISSKPFTQFPDFPMPDDYPDYPSHRRSGLLRCLRRALRPAWRITFNTSVVRVEAVDVQAPAPQWDVTVERDGKQAKIRYDGVVVASRHNWNPKIPQYPGEFGGEVLHSADYRVRIGCAGAGSWWSAPGTPAATSP